MQTYLSPTFQNRKIMRLTTRLEKLEGEQPDTVLSRSELLLLVSLLARRDALFWPWRFQASRKLPHCEISQRQREYWDGTRGLQAKASGREQWKDLHFTRQRLIASGFVTANHSGGQVTSLFLTGLGEATSRALVGDRLHTCDDTATQVVYRLLQLKYAGKPVRESVLFCRDCVGSPSDWDGMTEMVLPFLTAGCVRAESDTIGRVAYAPTEVPLPEHINVNVESHWDFDDCYCHSFNAERKHLESIEPRDSDECYIPLPATGW